MVYVCAWGYSRLEHLGKTSPVFLHHNNNYAPCITLVLKTAVRDCNNTPTWDCTVSSVSYPPAATQRPRYHLSEEQSPGYQPESDS